jgi:glycosyltransferase involved in cell wall biosynthesis
VNQRVAVLHVIGRLNVGGPGRLVTGLASQAHHVVAAGTVQDGEVELADLSGVDLRRIPGLGRKVHAADDARALRALVQLLHEQRPSIIHSHTAKGGALGRVAAEPARVPARVHTFHGHLLHGYFSPRATRAVIAVERRLARRTDRLVAVGERVRDELLAAGIGRLEQYEVIPPGVTLPQIPDRDEARSRLGLDDDRPVVAYVGRLAGVKRPERVVEVARRLPGALVLMVGDGSERVRLQATAPGNVRFLGWRLDVETIYAAADVALLTSDNEGMPVSLIEAALAGVPAVCTDVGSAAEVVLDGDTGLVVPADVDAVAGAVQTLLQDAAMRHRMGRAAQARAVDSYSVERMLRSHLDLYAGLRLG